MDVGETDWISKVQTLVVSICELMEILEVMHWATELRWRWGGGGWYYLKTVVDHDDFESKRLGADGL